jgi:hypothetical protein
VEFARASHPSVMRTLGARWALSAALAAGGIALWLFGLARPQSGPGFFAVLIGVAWLMWTVQTLRVTLILARHPWNTVHTEVHDEPSPKDRMQILRVLDHPDATGSYARSLGTLRPMLRTTGTQKLQVSGLPGRVIAVRDPRTERILLFHLADGPRERSVAHRLEQERHGTGVHYEVATFRDEETYRSRNSTVLPHRCKTSAEALQAATEWCTAHGASSFAEVQRCGHDRADVTHLVHGSEVEEISLDTGLQ